MSNEEYENVPINEIFDDVLYIHDYNIVAIALRVSYLADKMRKHEVSLKKNKIGFATIKQELEEGKNLDKYRAIFLRINDELQSEAKKFDKLAEFDILGFSSIFYLLVTITEDKEILDLMSKRDLTLRKNEIIDLISYCQQILRNIEKYNK